jgi:DNA repair protein RadA/Sms
MTSKPSPNSQNPRFKGYSGVETTTVVDLASVPAVQEVRMLSGLSELDRVLGGGLVTGSVILIGGDPGIGKSTVLLQTLSHFAGRCSALYVTGEESLQQIKLRAERLGLADFELNLLAETAVERILEIAAIEKPQMMVVDSIQTMYTELLQSAPGSVGQVRESAAQLVRYAKQTGTALFLVGHVTKEGTLAGPRVLEHMVDTVLYFEGDPDSRFRVIRAVKNRFGAVNELGIFAMTDRGLKEVNNPSAIFLSRYKETVAGSVIMATWEGSRPMLIEVQALVDESHLANPRRVTVGLEQNRLALALAVLHRHCGVVTYNQDVFVNIVGGVRVTETAADLAMLLAVVSSLKNCPLPSDLIVFGEVGLAGEIRPVQSGQERLREAYKHGFKRAIIPHGNAPKIPIEGMEVRPIKRLSEVLNYI